MTSRIPKHLERILDLARWAPSGDNTQPWRFEILGPEHILVHGFDTRDHCVYDLDGHASQIALGALLETIHLAATAEGCRALISRQPDTPDYHLLFDVRFERDALIQADPLVSYIEKRVVQRRALSARPLTKSQKASLEAAVGNSYTVLWYERLAGRWRVAKLCFDNAKIRLTIPEAYVVHRAVIQWGARYSEDRIPDQALGANAVTLRLMRWVMASWGRVEFFNTWLFGHLMPRIELDLLPGLRCAAHFALLAHQPVKTIDDYVAAGRAMQRFWLTATQQGLYVQPELTPLIFARYWREGRMFTRLDRAWRATDKLNGDLAALLGGLDLESVFFLGRIGSGPAPTTRSLRLPLASLSAHR